MTWVRDQKKMVNRRKNVKYKWNWWKLLTIGRFNSVIGDRPFGFFATCFGFGVVFLVTGRCFRWWRWFFGCCFILITITVFDATYSYCYWITIRWHSIALLWMEERKKNAHRYINHTHANLAFICKFVFFYFSYDWIAQLVLFYFVLFIPKKNSQWDAREKNVIHMIWCVLKAPVSFTRLHWINAIASNPKYSLDLFIHYNVIMYQCSNRILFVFFEQQ